MRDKQNTQIELKVIGQRNESELNIPLRGHDSPIDKTVNNFKSMDNSKNGEHVYTEVDADGSNVSFSCPKERSQFYSK